MPSPTEPHHPASTASDADARTTANPPTMTTAATIGASTEQPDAGWWAITDTGARTFVPGHAVHGYRTLRPGQRVALTWRETPQGPEVVAAQPPAHD